jgi:hypothetical protein
LLRCFVDSLRPSLGEYRSNALKWVTITSYPLPVQFIANKQPFIPVSVTKHCSWPQPATAGTSSVAQEMPDFMVPNSSTQKPVTRLTPKPRQLKQFVKTKCEAPHHIAFTIPPSL